MNRLTEEFKHEFGAHMNDEFKMVPNEFYLIGMEILRKHNLLKEMVIAPIKVLVHKENRNRHMIKALDAHEKGEYVYGVGCDRSQMSKAICCELAPMGPMRLTNIQKNKDLVDMANGLLAPINGTEEYLSLSCSHFTAFCRAANHGCKTPRSAIANGAGRIDAHRLKQQSEWRAVLEVGWSWTIIPWEIDIHWPRFAKVLQRALNTGNHIVRAVNLTICKSDGTV